MAGHRSGSLGVSSPAGCRSATRPARSGHHAPDPPDTTAMGGGAEVPVQACQQPPWRLWVTATFFMKLSLPSSRNWYNCLWSHGTESKRVLQPLTWLCFPGLPCQLGTPGARAELTLASVVAQGWACLRTCSGSVCIRCLRHEENLPDLMRADVSE